MAMMTVTRRTEAKRVNKSFFFLLVVDVPLLEVAGKVSFILDDSGVGAECLQEVIYSEKHY